MLKTAHDEVINDQDNSALPENDPNLVNADDWATDDEMTSYYTTIINNGGIIHAN